MDGQTDCQTGRLSDRLMDGQTVTPLAHCVRPLTDPIDCEGGRAAVHCGSIRSVGSVGSVNGGRMQWARGVRLSISRLFPWQPVGPVSRPFPW
ncbi:unnamed protein product [Arctogadus glacialis]